MSAHTERDKVGEKWFAFLRTFPRFPVERQAELHAEFMAGYDGVNAARDAAAEEARRKAERAEREAA